MPYGSISETLSPEMSITLTLDTTRLMGLKVYLPINSSPIAEPWIILSLLHYMKKHKDNYVDRL